MQKTVFRVGKMDCSAEEQLIRLRLADQPAVQHLHFDLPGRQLTVWHTGSAEPVAASLGALRLDSTLLGTEAAAPANLPDHAPHDRRLLWAVLGINAFFFVLEAGAGWAGHSLGLVADALDMLADALVYGLALYVVGRTAGAQQRVARFSGYLQLGLAVGGLLEVGHRFVSGEAEPRVGLMLGVSALALLGNAASLYLLQQARSRQAHIQASQVFTSNDVIVNLGVMVAAGLVYVTRSPWPDLVVGLIVFGLVARGAFRIFQLAR